MSEDKTQAIEQAKTVEALAKQEEKREEAKAKAEGQAKIPAPVAEKKEVKKKLVLDRVVTFNLSSVYSKPRSHRARIALSLLRTLAARHAKAKPEHVKIDSAINELIQTRGARSPAKAVKVKLTKDEAGLVSVVSTVEAKPKVKKERKPSKPAAPKSEKKEAKKPEAKAKPAAPKAAKPAASKDKK